MRQRKGALHVLWRIRIDLMEFPQIILPLNARYRSRSSKVRYYKCDVWRCSPSAFESQLHQLRRYMIQILLLRLCWQWNSCAILKILRYHSKILPRRNKYREKTQKAAQPVTRPHDIYWKLLVLLPELSIFPTNRTNFLQSYAQKRTFRCSS